MFSVPQEDEFQYELNWAKKYHVDVVEDFSYRDCIPPFVFQNFARRAQRIAKWIKAVRSADIIVEMSAISYTGPPIGSTLSVLLSGRLRYLLAAQFLNRKLFAWTQSYGPLSTALIRLLSKWDLGKQPAVFCRGGISQKNVSQLLPHKKTYSFPDVATILEFDKEWGRRYVQNIFSADLDFNKLITISPSAVIFARTKNKNRETTHVNHILYLCHYLFKKGYTILLVPHTFRPQRHYPEICDYAVSEIILNKLHSHKSRAKLQIVRDDLSPVQLKSIISTAAVHVGARYHSLIASLSSEVPSVCLSWHHKYADLMTQYKMQEYVFHETELVQPARLIPMFDSIIENKEKIKEKLNKEQKKIRLQIEHNTKLFVDLIKRYHIDSHTREKKGI